MTETRKCKCGRPLEEAENICPRCRNQNAGKIARVGQWISAGLGIVAVAVPILLKTVFKKKE